MNNEDELVKTLIKKHKKQKQPNNEQPPQQINKVVIDYDQIVIALPHFPKPTKIRINGPKILVDNTPVTAIKGLLDENKTKRKKAKKVNLDEKNETQMEKSVVSNGVHDFESKPCLSGGKDESLVGKKRKKKVNLGEKNETQMEKSVVSNGVNDFEPKPCSSGGKDESLVGKKRKRKVNLGEENETQMEKSVVSNGVEDFNSKIGLGDGKDEPMEGKKKNKKKKKEVLDEKNETQMGKGVCSNGVDDCEGMNKVVKRKRGLSVGCKEESVDCKFPVNRIVRIIKSQGDDYKLGHEAVFLINKATEKFIELFSEDAYDCALEEKKSFVGYKHLSAAVGKEKRLDFLSDFVPEKITAEKALAARKSTETLPS